MRNPLLLFLLILLCPPSGANAQRRDIDSLRKLTVNGSIPFGRYYGPEREKAPRMIPDSSSPCGGVYVDESGQPIHGRGSCYVWMPDQYPTPGVHYWIPGICENPVLRFEIPANLRDIPVRSIGYQILLCMSDGIPVCNWRVSFSETTVGRYADDKEFLDDDECEVYRSAIKTMYFEDGLLDGKYTIEWERVTNRHAGLRSTYEARFSSGTGEYVDVYPNGEVMIHGKLVDGMPHGEWRFYNRSEVDVIGRSELYWVLAVQYDYGEETGRQWLVGNSLLKNKRIRKRRN